MVASAPDVNGASGVCILDCRKDSPSARLPLRLPVSPVGPLSIHVLTSFKTNYSMIPIVCYIGSKESLVVEVTKMGKTSPFVNAVIANLGIGRLSNALNGGFGFTLTLTMF